MSLPLYGSKAFREASGDTLRPGGLKLTAYGLDLMRKAGLPKGASVLDCGCGPGGWPGEADAVRRGEAVPSSEGETCDLVFPGGL